MTAPTEAAQVAAEPAIEVGPEIDGEMALNFPVLVLEAVETSDGRFLNAGSLTHRALPLSLLACPESAHGGNDPDAAVVVGRIDTLTRTPGPEVVSKRTGEPFPEGSFVWSATGAMYSDVSVGKHNIGDLVRRRFLRGVSVDLAGMDVEMIGDEQLAESDHPRRRMVAHAAEISAATLVPIPAFGDAYVEIAGEDFTPDLVSLDELPEGLAASAFPAWRSPEVGDPVAVVASAEPWPAAVPEDAVDQLAAVIADDGGQQRDAAELATAIVDYIAAQWAAGDTDTAMPDDDDPIVAAAPSAKERADAEDDGDTYPGTDRFPIDTRDRAASAVKLYGSSDLPAEKVKAWLIRRLKAKGWDDLIPDAWLGDGAHTAQPAEPEMPDEVGDPEMVDETGMPDAPQDCEQGHHAAARSLLYDDRRQYAATCDAHDEWAREQIAGLGFEVDEVVEIAQPADDTEEVPA